MKTANSDLRSFIRHPVDVPIVCQVNETDSGETPQLTDISEGGVSFTTDHFLAPGATVNIIIDLVKPVFTARATVAWCHQEGHDFRVGVAFVDPGVDYKARMVEQLCHIEQYRQNVLKQEGRRLTPQQAAFEWIQKHASEFPGFPDRQR